MWEENWINLTMKMRDMPYYSYKKTGDNAKEPNEVEGTVEILKEKFSKYIIQ